MDKKGSKEVKPKKVTQQLTSVIKEDTSEKMKIYFLIAVAAILLLCIIGIIQYRKSNTPSSINDTLINDTLINNKLNDDVAKLAACLSSRGFRMYGSATCGACNAQKQMFGEDFDKINYVECSQNAPNSRTQECITAGIQAVPTWEVEGELLQPRVRTLEILKEESGC